MPEYGFSLTLVFLYKERIYGEIQVIQTPYSGIFYAVLTRTHYWTMTQSSRRKVNEYFYMKAIFSTINTFVSNGLVIFQVDYFEYDIFDTVTSGHFSYVWVGKKSNVQKIKFIIGSDTTVATNNELSKRPARFEQFFMTRFLKVQWTLTFSQS